MMYVLQTIKPVILNDDASIMMILYYSIKEVKCLLNKWRHFFAIRTNGSGEELRKKRNRFSVHFAKREVIGHMKDIPLSFSPDILVPKHTYQLPSFSTC